jgi:xanthine/uracil permease
LPAQAFLGHKRAIMEWQSGLWWGGILTICYSAGAEGMPLGLAKLFNLTVNGVFMFLLGCKLISIFLKGMLGIPFGQETQGVHIDLSGSLLSILVAILVILISIKAPISIRRYGLLIGIIAGWVCHAIIFKTGESVGAGSSSAFELYPLGRPAWNVGVILTAVFTGLLNAANTFGALKGTDSMYQTETSKAQYLSSFMITGLFTGIAGVFGLVPYSPYVSSIGFLSQTGIIKRLPFVLGSFMFLVMGIIPPVGRFFSMLPLSIGSAVLFVSYLQLLNSAWKFFETFEFNTLNIYRSAITLFVGIVIMSMPVSYFATLPGFIRPLLSSGLLVGLFLALVLENLFHWDNGV